MNDASTPDAIDIAAIIIRMDLIGRTIPALLSDLSRRDLRWRPDDGGWSILEIVCHLGDEEEWDFRDRLQSTLEDPHRQWQPIDPVSWAVDRKYNNSDPAEAIKRFSDERQLSVGWLRSLQSPNWSAAYDHPQMGPVSAGELLASWSAHDALHLRQIAKRMHQLVAVDAPGFKTTYAGEWKA